MKSIGFFVVVVVCLFNLVGNLPELSPQSCHSLVGLQLKFLVSSFRLCRATWHLSYICIGSAVGQIFGQSLYPESGLLQLGWFTFA